MPSDMPSPNRTKSSPWRTAGMMVLAVAAGAGGAWAVLRRPSHPGPAQAAAPLDQGKPLFYRNPMNPAITSPTFMKDEMGMDYIPV